MMLVAVAAFTLATTSCAKDWTCSCSATVLGTNISESEDYADLKKSEASDKCDALEAEAKNNPLVTNASCDLSSK